MRVLIADDSAVMRMILERGLRRAGFEAAHIFHAANGLEALARLEQAKAEGHLFELILTDVHMPFMDGPEFLAEACRRGLTAGVAVVMITAEDTVGIPPAALPGIGRLNKPFTMEQMQASLAPLLQAAHG